MRLLLLFTLLDLDPEKARNTPRPNTRKILLRRCGGCGRRASSRRLGGVGFARLGSRLRQAGSRSRSSRSGVAGGLRVPGRAGDWCPGTLRLCPVLYPRRRQPAPLSRTTQDRLSRASLTCEKAKLRRRPRARAGATADNRSHPAPAQLPAFRVAHGRLTVAQVLPG